MIEETLEAKLKRHEDALVACMAEIEKLRAENARLRSESDAHTVLKEIYSNPDAPQANRIKAAAASLAHEKPRLMPQPAPLDLPCEEIEPWRSWSIGSASAPMRCSARRETFRCCLTARFS
jgi:hypothetical protein